MLFIQYDDVRNRKFEDIARNLGLSGNCILLQEQATDKLQMMMTMKEIINSKILQEIWDYQELFIQQGNNGQDSSRSEY